MAVSITPGQRAIVAMMAPEVRDPKVVAVRPEPFSEARVKECYRNAMMYAVSHECDYVLGLLFYQGAIPIEHAWVHDPKRGHLDVTITKTEAAGAKHDGKSFYVELFRPTAKWAQWFTFKNSMAPSLYDVRKALKKGQAVLEGQVPSFDEYVGEMAAITKVGKRIMADGTPLVPYSQAVISPCEYQRWSRHRSSSMISSGSWVRSSANLLISPPHGTHCQHSTRGQTHREQPQLPQ